MSKQARFIIRKIIKIFLTLFVSIISVRSKNLVVMGLRTRKTFDQQEKDYFMHNTKYLFLYLKQEKRGLRVIYLCDDDQMIERFKNRGYNDIYKRHSLQGLYYSLRAKYWIFDTSKYDVSEKFLSGGAICINLWHGAGGLKRVGYDLSTNSQKLPFLKKIQAVLLDKDSKYIVNSNYEAECRKLAFKINDKRIKFLGSPRLDVLYNNIPNSDLFMEEDFARIETFKEQGKRLLFYTPTFRDTGKDISGWLKSDKLRLFLKNNNIIMVCKLHFADKNSLNFKLTEEFYKMDSNSDIYPVLKYSDALITDYSSIYFDYLHLNKPIIYHIPDLEEYETQCRGFYRPYETLTAGVYTKTEEELLNAIYNIANGIDNYKEQRKKLLNEMFVYQDGRNCERMFEWIKSLN